MGPNKVLGVMMPYQTSSPESVSPIERRMAARRSFDTTASAAQGATVTYTIAEPCIDVKDKACVEECPVDCIYIDPPYNTGARDWKYNNHYVDDQDAWRHSKWLSFIEKRLLLALEPEAAAHLAGHERRAVHAQGRQPVDGSAEPAGRDPQEPRRRRVHLLAVAGGHARVGADEHRLGG